MRLSRESDRREGICFRQGKGWFELASAGHEAIAAIVFALEPEDYIYPHYRDRAMMLARGISVYELALGFFGKAESSSGGRQLANHYSDAKRRVMSCASPVALQALPAVGTAWYCKLRERNQVVVCCIGEASIRQGEFYEALSFALQEQLPVVFIVEDNGYGVSTATTRTNPYSLGVLAESHRQRLDGRDPETVRNAAVAAVERAKRRGGPSVLWFEVDRIQSHSSSDDQRLYRSAAEIAAMQARDPISRLRDRLISNGCLTGDEWDEESAEIARFVDFEYQRAEGAGDPSASEVQTHIFSSTPMPLHSSGLPSRADWTMAAAINHTLRDLLSTEDHVLLFGEDIEDPKGGVFGLTKGLSHSFPGRVINSPLAESSIAGLACGAAIAGAKPIFELQFIDFVGPAFNQIVNQIATLRWRTAGAWRCPLVFLAPSGAYLPAGGPWHSQTNEAWFAHAPGLRLAIPSTAQDAAAMVRAAVAGEDPVLLLLPKHLFRKHFGWELEHPRRLGEARVCREGIDVTAVAWGNCCELAMKAAESMEKEGVRVEVVNLRSLVPCDWMCIRRSLEKTGRILVVQEDSRTCSFGQAIIAEIASRPAYWDLLAAPPQLLSRPDVHVGFHPILEAAVLPGIPEIRASIRRLMEF